MSDGFGPAHSSHDRDPRGTSPVGAADMEHSGRMSVLVRHRLTVALIFLVGLYAHLTVLRNWHREGDELIYQTLVEQLASGRGYTLQGTWLLERRLLDAQYNRPLFHHPPAGIVFFWIARAMFGGAGFACAQLASYALWFVSVLALARALTLERYGPAVLTAVSLAALQPILSHVLTRYWLDAPLLAMTTLAAACTAWSIRRDSRELALCAGLVLGLASLIKPTAFVIAPGLSMLALSLRGTLPLRRLLALGIWTFGVAVLAHAPWVLWRWWVLGPPWSALQGQADAGRPSASLIASNLYVRFVTIVRPAWCYLTLLPRVCWTLVPSFVLALCTRRNVRTEPRSLVTPLVGWIAIVVGLHVALGAIGYSKVLRYVILIAPASVLLPAVLVSRLWPRVSAVGVGERNAPSRAAAFAGLALLAVSGALELAQGLEAAQSLNAVLIKPWFGGFVF